MQNPFENPGFSMVSLTAAINLIPNRYGRLESLNLFPVRPVRTRQIIVEEYAGRLNLLPTRAPGSPGTVGERGKRKLRSFVIPHIPHDDVVLPEEVQGLRAFGSETEMEAIGGVMARHLETMRNKHAITLEHLRMGALRERSWMPMAAKSLIYSTSSISRRNRCPSSFLSRKTKATSRSPVWNCSV